MESQKPDSINRLQDIAERDAMVYFRPTSIPLCEESCEQVKKEINKGVSDEFFQHLFVYLRGLGYARNNEV